MRGRWHAHDRAHFMCSECARTEKWDPKPYVNEPVSQMSAPMAAIPSSNDGVTDAVGATVTTLYCLD